MNKTLKITGWIVCILFTLGVIFKIMHWPGAGIILVLGGFLYLTIYLPFWLIYELKNNNWKLYTWVQYFTLSLWILATIFKTQHWLGAGPLYYLLLFCSILVLFPIYLIKINRKSIVPSQPFEYHFTFFVIILGLNFFLFATGSVSKNFVNMITTNNNNQVENAYTTISKKNNLLYNALNGTLSETEKKESQAYQKTVELKKYVQETDGFIKEIKRNIISKTEDISLQQADSIKIAKINDKLNTDIPTTILLSDKSIYNGSILKQRIEKFKDSIVKIVSVDKQNFIREGIELNTEDSRDEEGEVFSWVNQNFDHQPLTSVLNTLTNLQVEIKFAEQQVLSELFNQTLASKTDNIAAKISEYGMKYENEKKQKEIELLKKDKEFSNILLDTKNQAIAAQEQTIFAFIVGMLLVVVLIFYVSRSNIQRKKANTLLSAQKELIGQQKEIVEQKQKEIIDSINYAKRIQTALLPNEKYISKNISRLKIKQ